ncbi:MAG TPA: AAA family ATPase, partial [Labilithrix sp.]
MNAATVQKLQKALRAVMQGKDDVIDLLLVGLLASGHVLVEDVPGVGKTTLAKALARALDVTFTRVQFTTDLLPTDILGTQVLNPKDGTFAFQRGPIFTNVLLADEINRASPRTQSALLEAMNEAQVTVDGVTHALAAPFFVVATQNPADYQGTYPLPEAQLDRFLLRIGVGYPGAEAELAMLTLRRTSDPLTSVEAVCDKTEIARLQAEAREVEVKEAVARYALAIVQKTR